MWYILESLFWNKFSQRRVYLESAATVNMLILKAHFDLRKGMRLYSLLVSYLSLYKICVTVV